MNDEDFNTASLEIFKQIYWKKQEAKYCLREDDVRQILTRQLKVSALDAGNFVNHLHDSHQNPTTTAKAGEIATNLIIALCENARIISRGREEFLKFLKEFLKSDQINLYLEALTARTTESV